MNDIDKQFLQWLESQILKADATCRPQYRNAYEIVKYKFNQLKNNEIDKMGEHYESN